MANCPTQELRKVDLNAKMSKSKKKKLKKREKRNQQLMEDALKHAENNRHDHRIPLKGQSTSFLLLMIWILKLEL